MMRLFATLALISAFAISPSAFSACITGDALFGHPELRTLSADFQDYTIRLYDDDVCDAKPDTPKAGFEIIREGKPVASGTGYSFALGYALQDDQSIDSAKVKIGDDITGEGIPDLLITEWSGGTHCCYTFHLFQLGAEFRMIQSIPLLDADEATFVRRRGVTGLVLIATDYSAFANFPSGFATSPAGRVLLSFQRGRFRLDPALMHATAPKASEIRHCAGLFKKSRGWKAGPPMGMWYFATDLIYAGHERSALEFLKTSWGGRSSDRHKYLGEYRRRLRKSAYYPEIKLLQARSPSTIDQKIDWTKQCFEYMHG